MPQGFAFVHTAEGEYFIPESKMRGAFDGDLVELAPVSVNRNHHQPSKLHTKTGEKPTARVLRVIDRAHDTVVGRYEIAEPFGVVVPQDKRINYDIFTMRTDNPHLQEGDVVRVRITDYPTPRTAATGIIEEVLGHESDAALGVEMIIARYKLETRFSAEAAAQASRTKLDISGALLEGYRDLRDRRVFTIDPIDARDFDDALSVEAVDGLVRLGVHIADVSHYVPWASPIDLEAQKRATSVYLADRVLPMLPEELSADICSLKPDTDRLSMTVDLYLDDACEVRRAEMYPAVIRSSARLNYDLVQEVLDGEKVTLGVDTTLTAAIKADIAELHRIGQARYKKRTIQGGIDFVTTEAKVMLDAQGKLQEILLRKKTNATSLIEEAMLLANETVAKHLFERGFPSIYRVHEKPSADDLAETVAILKEFDYLKSIPVADFVVGDPFSIQKVLAACKGRTEEELISSLVLRAMSRAIYQKDCEAHYALAMDAYCHFTSPIRRYPDLVVHRMLKAQLLGKSGTFEQEKNRLETLAKHSSEAERTAEAAARESQELKIIESLQEHIGETFEAVISGVTGYGFFARLDNTAEGLVHLKNLGHEYFAHDPKRHTLTGEDSGKCYRLGQRIMVVLEAADPRLGHLDFNLPPYSSS